MTTWQVGILVAAGLVVLAGGAGIVRSPAASASRTRRIAWWLGAVVALTLLALRPSWTLASPGGVLLVTPGSRVGSLRSLAERVGPGWQVFDLAGGVGGRVFPTAGGAGDLAGWALATERELGGPVVVTGWGLHEEEWSRWGLRPTENHPPGEPSGLLEIAWPRSLAPGETFEVRAQVRYPEATTVRLVGPGGVEEAVDVPGTSVQSVVLRAQPRVAGRIVYRWEEEVVGRVAPARRLDVVVEEVATPWVLWIEGAPSFESREVRSWLAGLGGGVGLRSRISRDRFRVEALNVPAEVDPARLDPGLVRRFDVVVIDLDAWRDLGAVERRALEDEVTHDGLGVLLLLRQPFAASLPWGFELEPVTGGEESGLTRPGWAGAPPDVPALEGMVRRLRLGAGARVLVEDRAGEPLAGWRELGRGRVGATLVTESFLWALEGRGEVHRSLWSHLLSTVARPVAADRWALPPGPIVADSPLRAVVDSATPLPSVRLHGPAAEIGPVATRQDVTLPARWHVAVVPWRLGWHRLASPQGEVWFHVDEPFRWRDLDRARRYEATRAAVAGTHLDTPPAPRGWPARVLLWLLAVGCLAGLWADERVHGGAGGR